MIPLIIHADLSQAHPNWQLQAVIIKLDDVRQEQLAVQIISTIQQIFIEAEIPLWLRAYNVRTFP